MVRATIERRERRKTRPTTTDTHATPPPLLPLALLPLQTLASLHPRPTTLSSPQLSPPSSSPSPCRYMSDDYTSTYISAKSGMNPEDASQTGCPDTVGGWEVYASGGYTATGALTWTCKPSYEEMCGCSNFEVTGFAVNTATLNTDWSLVPQADGVTDHDRLKGRPVYVNAAGTHHMYYDSNFGSWQIKCAHRRSTTCLAAYSCC